MPAINANAAVAAGTDTRESALSPFRDADFLAIMLAEIANQDPFEPTKTSDMVENMQKLQELANVQYEKFRADLRWAEELIGKNVTLQQVVLPPDAAQRLVESGVNPDVGYGLVEGPVDTYRVVGETVWVSVGGREYPVDNVQRVLPANEGNRYMVELAQGLLGREVILDSQQGASRGTVMDVYWNDRDEVVLNVDGYEVPFEAIRGIGTPAA